MYFDKVEELENSLTLAHRQVDIERLHNLSLKAQLCNRVIEQIRHEARNSDVAAIARRVLDNNELAIEQMGAILFFAPQWSTTLMNYGDTSALRAASLYQVEFIRRSDGAVFYKVGHTGRPVTTRLSGFKYDKRKFSANVHHQILFAKKHVAAAEEARLHLANTALRYDGEPFLTNGHTEVYTEPLLRPRLRLEISLYALLGISRD